MATATVTRRPLPTLKTRSLPAPPRQKSPEKSSPHVLKNEREINPIEKRLISIRLHLLHNTSRRTQPPSEPTLVFEPFLYLGGMKSLSNKTRLNRLKITHILSVVYIPPNRSSIPLHIKHLFLKADDYVGFNMRQYFEQACQFIEEARQSNGAVLVHCVCGISRSTTLCCAYLMKHHSMTLEEALVHLRVRRHIIQPNNGFLKQLILYDEQLHREHLDRDRAMISNVTHRLESL